jgi:hypothetical protein
MLLYSTTPETQSATNQPPTSLTDEQKALWKQGKCFKCKQQFQSGHRCVCPKRCLDVNNVEKDEGENLQINDNDEYSSISSKKPQKIPLKIQTMGMKCLKLSDHSLQMF